MKSFCCPHCSKSIDPALITAARQSELAGRKRPGALGLVRNPKGRPARKDESADYGTCSVCRRPQIGKRHEHPCE